MAKQPAESKMPFPNVDEALVPPTLSDPEVNESPFVMVDVPVPCTMRSPVVVAPPEMVSPVCCVPPPIVVEPVAPTVKTEAPVEVMKFAKSPPNPTVDDAWINVPAVEDARS